MNHHSTKIIVFRILLLSFSLALFGCPIEPKVSEYDTAADAQFEIQKLSEDLLSAKSQQVDLLAPTNFEASIHNRNEAIQKRSQGRSTSQVLHRIAVSRKYLDQANTIATNSFLPHKNLIKARQDARSADAELYFPNEMKQLDDEVKKQTVGNENHSQKISPTNQAELGARYSEIELRSIKQKRLGSAWEKIQSAKNEGAQKLVPETLQWAEMKYLESEAKIEDDRHSIYVLTTAAEAASRAADRLLAQVRAAKGTIQSDLN